MGSEAGNSGSWIDDQTYEMIKKVAELTNRSPSELIREVL